MNDASRIHAFARFAVAAARRAANVGADVVFATSTPLTIALPAVFAARRCHIPMVLEVRDLWPEMPIAVGALRNPLSRGSARMLERFAYANAARIVALSPGMAEGIARAGYPPERITVVPNAADLGPFERDPARGQAFRDRIRIPAERMLVAYVGTLGRINGVGYLARLAAALKDDDRLTFLIVGDGQEREEIETIARDLGVLGRNLLMRPSIAKQDVADVLFASDIATSLFAPIPEMEANSANKYFDSLAAGCCTVVNYGGWQAELLERHEAGVRLPQDPAAAAIILRSLAGDRGRVERAGRNARHLAEREFSRDVLANRMENVLADAVTASAVESRGASLR